MVILLFFTLIIKINPDLTLLKKTMLQAFVRRYLKPLPWEAGGHGMTTMNIIWRRGVPCRPMETFSGSDLLMILYKYSPDFTRLICFPTRNIYLLEKPIALILL